MHHTIVSGSKEYILVKLGDRLEDVDDATPLSPTFTVYDPTDTAKQTNVPADVDADDKMIVKCLVDTTAGGNWVSNIYRLYVKLTASPEAPILGPIPFKVEVI